MHKPIRFLMIGGFLGAGKTTAIGRLASHYVAQGKNVAIVTNDQAYDLVDTHTLRAGGFHVGEVPGACFCCKFDDLVGTISDLSSQSVPDIVIAEPVGSCTDLVATVIEPMQQLLGDRFELGPLVVLLKPEHGRKILCSTSGRGFSPKAEYIFLKQLEEADAIAVNKIDKLSESQQQELLDRLADRFPETSAFGISARDGDGFQLLIDAASGLRTRRLNSMSMDYGTYAEGEAELGWLNGQITAQSEQKFSLDDVTLAIVNAMEQRLTDQECEVAHLKVLGQTLNDAAVANVVGGGSQAELSLASEIKTLNAELLVNARVAADPELLESIVHAAAGDVQQSLAVSLNVGEIQRFRPAPPQPTHRRK